MLLSIGSVGRHDQMSDVRCPMPNDGRKGNNKMPHGQRALERAMNWFCVFTVLYLYSLVWFGMTLRSMSLVSKSLSVPTADTISLLLLLFKIGGALSNDAKLIKLDLVDHHSTTFSRISQPVSTTLSVDPQGKHEAASGLNGIVIWASHQLTLGVSFIFGLVEVPWLINFYTNRNRSHRFNVHGLDSVDLSCQRGVLIDVRWSLLVYPANCPALGC